MIEPAERGVGELVEDDDVLARRRLAAQHALADQLVHVDVGLVQPQALQRRSGRCPRSPACSTIISETIGTTSLEHLAALLHEQLVARRPTPSGRRAVQEAEVVADVVGELRLQPRAQDLPAAAWPASASSTITAVADVAEDEVAVAVAEVQVARADLRIDHQHGACAEPEATKSAAVLMPKVAEEQATFMSKAKPSMPSACCTSMAMAG